MTIFKSFGHIKYRKNGWVTLYCCRDLLRYYQAQIKEKPQLLQLPMHGSHITICNGRWEKPNASVWGKHGGKKVWFTYSNEIKSDRRFYWIEIRCPFLDRLRNDLGLIPLRQHPILKRGLHMTLARKADYKYH